MDINKKNKKGSSRPKVAPGMTDARFGEKASREDIKNGNYTRMTRVFLDENDPG